MDADNPDGANCVTGQDGRFLYFRGVNFQWGVVIKFNQLLNHRDFLIKGGALHNTEAYKKYTLEYIVN